jgi:hypothetical protein
MSQPDPSHDVIAINLFSMAPGIDPAEFERFSNEVDRPTCLAFGDVVKGFDAYRVVGRPDDPAADIVEVMQVSDWPTWEKLRDNDPAFAPVMDGFNKLVDPNSVRTIFARPILPTRPSPAPIIGDTQ